MRLLRTAGDRLGIDRAVSFAVAARAWQIPSAIVTMLLISVSFDGVGRGLYLLLISQTGLQSLADAGLLNTILHAASHEAAATRFDQRGFLHASKATRQRLAGLLRFATIYFSAAAVLLFAMGVGVGGVLLWRRDLIGPGALPLVVAMALAALALCIAPLIAMVEGVGQVHTVNRYRLGQVITGSLIVWLLMSLGVGLWAPAGAIAVQLLWEGGLALVRFGPFFRQLMRHTSGRTGMPRAEDRGTSRTRRTRSADVSPFRWRSEIWPLQWRVGVQSAARYLAFYPIYPLLFDSQGPLLAGRYGMTWQVLSNLLMMSYAYFRTRSPQFGRAIAEQRRADSRKMFWQTTLGSSLLLVILLISFCLGLSLCRSIDLPLLQPVQRMFLSSGLAWALSAAVLSMHLANCFAMYILSQKFDPVWRVSVPLNVLLAVMIYFAATAGWILGIAGAITWTYAVCCLVLAVMSRRYDRHFQRIEHGVADGTPASKQF